MTIVKRHYASNIYFIKFLEKNAFKFLESKLPPISIDTFVMCVITNKTKF
jgi:hypothetical protein